MSIISFSFVYNRKGINMNVNRMKKRILLLLLVIPALIKAQDVMTETRQDVS